ncbi:hypothetical protein ACHWQZ_G006721 [Mnemiopsis leidyi]
MTEGHVFVEGYSEGNNYSGPGDAVLGSGLVLCTLVGLTGNIPAALYFWGRRTRTVYDLLYLVISCIDICTCTITFPVITSLLHDRRAMLFENYSFCAAWATAFYFIGRYLAFIAFVMSVTRTIAIYTPHYNVGNLPVKRICAVYFCLMAAFYISLFAFKSTWIIYSSVVVYCNPVFMAADDWVWYPYILTKLLILLLLPLSVLTSFLLSAVPLVTKRKLQCGDNSTKFWKASVTIALFTGLYLACHLPMFVITAMESARLWLDLEHPDSTFLYWYDYLLAEFSCTVLDSALNPCLYLWRMADFRRWVFGKCKKLEHFAHDFFGKQTGETTM